MRITPAQTSAPERKSTTTSRPAHMNRSNTLGRGINARASIQRYPKPMGRADHIARAVTQEFLLTKDIPLPGELTEALDFIQSAPTESITAFWRKQRERLRTLVSDADPDQLIWDADIPAEISPATGKMKTLAPQALLGHFDLGGARRIQQFNMGFP